MGQCINARNDTALDTIITNVVIIDSISGIIKADVGIRVLNFLLFVFLKKCEPPNSIEIKANKKHMF
jgi:archaellum biogenesis ATPase FlaH